MASYEDGEEHYKAPCGLCCQDLRDICYSCMRKSLGRATRVNDECAIDIGTCDHSFHSHCISERLNSSLTCPCCLFLDQSNADISVEKNAEDSQNKGWMPRTGISRKMMDHLLQYQTQDRFNKTTR